MTNLIVTIISIALVAVAAIMGIFYAGTAFQNNQTQVIANSITSEAQQILQATRIWSTNNNQPDISGMPNIVAVTNNVYHIINKSNTGMSLLISSGALSQWPSFAGPLAGPPSSNIIGPSPWGAASATTTAIGSFDSGCWHMNGQDGWVMRFIFAQNGSNYVAYNFENVTNPCASTGNPSFISNDADVSNINHPIVQIAKAINAKRGVPSNAYLSAMASGLPRAPIGSTNVGASSLGGMMVDTNGGIPSNYCYYLSGTANASATIITCVFGPG